MSETIKAATKPVVYAVLVLAIVAAVFLAASTAINTVAVEQVPLPLQSTVIFLKDLFNVPVVVFVITFVRGIFGYYRAKLKFGADVTYKVSKFGETVSLYVMVGISAFAAIPQYAPYVLAATFIIDVIQTEWQYYKQKT